MYKIGELSKLSKIPVKTLRFYDNEGILPPDSIDPFTGYRYYNAAKLMDCYRIVALKELGHLVCTDLSGFGQGAVRVQGGCAHLGPLLVHHPNDFVALLLWGLGGGGHCDGAGCGEAFAGNGSRCSD